MDTENLITVYLKLLGVLECPVCLDYLTKPVAVCTEGHALCSKCKSNVNNSCPMCRNPISTARGLIIDQVIETLLYPCYKMGCGSLLKRSEAEVHDQTCALDVASDKQAVLHNNLLKNIEENFASFIVQPHVEKEKPQTRTVGTVTGKVKMADVRIQTSLPFSAKLQSPQAEVLNPDTTGFPSLLPVQTKGGLPSGTSIFLNDGLKNKFSGLNMITKPPFILGPSSSNASQQPNNANSFLGKSFSPNPSNLGFKFNMGGHSSLEGEGVWTGNSLQQNPRPFQFTQVEQIDTENNATPKKPSTKLNFNTGHISEPGASGSNQGLCDSHMLSSIKPNDAFPCFSTSASPSSSLMNPTPPQTQSAGGATDSVISTSTTSFNASGSEFRTKPSTKMHIQSNLLNNLNNTSPQLNHALAVSVRKRPTTNLFGVTTPAC